MIVLLPPSETKHEPSRGRPLDLSTLSFPALATTRHTVLAALTAVSARPDAAAILGVSAGLAAQVVRNTRLVSAPTAPAGAIYTGVLYDALDLGSLDAGARRRAARRLLIVSALFGAVRLGDRIPAYRLSMGVDLPGVGRLAPAWRGPLSEVLPGEVGRGLVLDCRSTSYAAAWTPTGPLAQRWVHVRVPGVSHLAKHTRGLVARAVCESAQDPRHPADLAAMLTASGFQVALSSPARAGQPWLLDVSAGGRSG
ncbi:MAG: peroxide stress protein YaaA [Actinomycetales bacterium]|nr:peroxide stress protein YaaA [Candidatus Phosphoribacter baldrii]